MALDGSYGGLQASVADFLNRGDLTATIPDFITLAEAQMARRLVARANAGMAVPRRLIVRADAAIAQAAEYVAVPGDMLGPLDLMLQATPPIELDYLDPANLEREKARAVWMGAPKFYSVVGGELQLYPAADQDYDAELVYIARTPALSDAAPTNWVLQDYPDAYLYGALVQSAPYLRNDARAELWGTLFTAALDDMCNADPMPTDRSRLRTAFPALMRWGRFGAYDITSDS
ncbi:MAG TPA: hypothetical protein VHC39_16375 [Rhizomicrobium sp.]|nr:hypothetical protein [Rhizomicrobium sp.]